MTQNPDKVNRGIKCWLCKNEHRLMNCKQFLSKSFTEKKDFINKKRLCFNCLAKGHVLKECQSNFFCRIESCKKKHHTLLHEETQVNINVSSAKHNLSVTYLQVLQIYVSNGDVLMKVNALLDSGSDSSLVIKALSDKLKLEGKSQTLTLSNAVCSSTKTISFILHCMHQKYCKCMASRKPRFAEI